MTLFSFAFKCVMFSVLTAPHPPPTYFRLVINSIVPSVLFVACYMYVVLIVCGFERCITTRQ